MTPLKEGGFLIAKIHQLSGRIFAKKLKKYQINQINPAQGRILFSLWQKDNISINELAAKTSLGNSTLTSMLDRLEMSGYIKRVPHRKDRRKIMIQRTEKETEMRDIYEKASREMTDLFYSGFKEEEIKTFEKNLKRILNTLELTEE
jgi:DNA-binding MarR family transcriptional regulator